MSSLCPKCNQSIEDKNKFCINCGAENPNYNPNAAKRKGIESLENHISDQLAKHGYADDQSSNGVYSPRFTGFFIRTIFSIIFVILFFLSVRMYNDASYSVEETTAEIMMMVFFYGAIRVYLGALIAKRKAEQEAKFMNDMHQAMQDVISK